MRDKKKLMTAEQLFAVDVGHRHKAIRANLLLE